ncbi:MAG: pyridoxamine 5'-phosphate oxidase family protein [Methanosphaera sp.]|nr:pyridoxamine 5'-phosphate oxidase family protein [Methanosphaera sp.]
MSDIEKVSEYLAEAGMFFLATTDGDQPKARPLGLQVLHDGKIYFGIGDFKDVYKQLQANPKLEIVASKGQDILRYYGVAKFDNNPEVMEKVWTILKDLKPLYDENNWNMELFYVDDATAEFRNMFSVEESFNFKY